jgi:hypothetical protein
MRNVSDKICGENQIKNTISYSLIFIFKSCLYEIVGECGTAEEEDVDDNTAHAHCMLDT